MKKNIFIAIMLVVALVIFVVDLGIGKGWAALPAFIAFVAMIHSKK